MNNISFDTNILLKLFSILLIIGSSAVARLIISFLIKKFRKKIRKSSSETVAQAENRVDNDH